jgi:gliding motility-associated-like protein
LKYKLLISLLILLNLAVFKGFGQLLVDPSQTSQQLVQNVLLGGGVTANNIVFNGVANGNSPQIGYFFGSSNIGMTTGIVLSTGNAIDAEGPNDLSGTSTDLLLAGDATLDGLVPNQITNDAAVLEFDFVPLSDTLSFRYVFASEEYMEWANSDFNDVFGFFISGPGIVGAQNIALIPGTSTLVSINNVNEFNNAFYYVDNGDGDSFSTPGDDGQTVQYDGFTKVLTATAIVQSCQTYHIKLAVADVFDGAFDSAVFLEAGSFSAGSIDLSAQSDYSSSLNDTALLEACGDSKIIFERTGNTTNPLTINFSLTGTATQGTDYTVSANSVTIPAGSTLASVDVSILVDGLAEGAETIIVTPLINIACQTEVPTLELTIVDQPLLNVSTTPDITTPCPAQTLIQVFPTGGTPGYTYKWFDANGTLISTHDTVSVFPLNSASFYVQVMDTCGTQIANDSVRITIPGYTPMEFIVNTPRICKGDTAVMIVNVSDGKAPYTYSWNFDGSTNNSAIASPSYPSFFTVVVTDLCGIVDSTRVLVEVVGPEARFTSRQTGAREFVFTNNSIDALNYMWYFGDGDTTNTFNAAHVYADSGWYPVTLLAENREGCMDTVRIFVHAYPDLNVYVPNAFTPNGDMVNDAWYAIGEGFSFSEVRIFNRWGAEVYRSKHQTWAWNGTSREGELLEGTFTYMIELITPLGDTEKKYGHVTVIR